MEKGSHRTVLFVLLIFCWIPIHDGTSQQASRPQQSCFSCRSCEIRAARRGAEDQLATQQKDELLSRPECMPSCGDVEDSSQPLVQHLTRLTACSTWGRSRRSDGHHDVNADCFEDIADDPRAFYCGAQKLGGGKQDEDSVQEGQDQKKTKLTCPTTVCASILCCKMTRTHTIQRLRGGRQNDRAQGQQPHERTELSRLFSKRMGGATLLRYYRDANGKRVYTMQKIDPTGLPTLPAHPPKFNPGMCVCVCVRIHIYVHTLHECMQMVATRGKMRHELLDERYMHTYTYIHECMQMVATRGSMCCLKK
jgi:hypothetical protein